MASCTARVATPAISRPSRLRPSWIAEAAASSQAPTAIVRAIVAAAGTVVIEMNTPTSADD